jgi:acetoin utilization deacetylase AcuC-like enzyme
MGSHHPESPLRLTAIEDQLIAADLLHYLRHYDAPLATFEQLARVHTQHYIETIQQAAPKEGLVYLDPDTAMNPFTLNAALRAAGAVVLATELVMEHKAANAFCAIRPPGHHACSSRAMGFCFFNNLAVGVAHAIEKYSLQRIAIADFDVHHGNGTEEIFRNNPHIMLFSTFQHPFYPHIGAESSSKNIVNVPLPAGANGVAFRKAITEEWLPTLDNFRPEMIFISAGFDAHIEDEMSQLRLNESDYAWITEKIKGIAARHAQGRIVSVLEGGYSLHALGRSVAAHVRVLCKP